MLGIKSTPIETLDDLAGVVARSNNALLSHSNMLEHQIGFLQGFTVISFIALAINVFSLKKDFERYKKLQEKEAKKNRPSSFYTYKCKEDDAK